MSCIVNRQSSFSDTAGSRSNTPPIMENGNSEASLQNGLKCPRPPSSYF